MPTRVATAAAVALGLVCPAHAETHISVKRELTLDDAASARSTTGSLAIGKPTRGARIDKLALELRSDAAAPNARLVLELSTHAKRSDDPKAMDVETLIDVPRGTRVVGMTLAMGSETSKAAALSPFSASQDYERVMFRGRDPALLSFQTQTEAHDRLSLRVFPLVAATPAKVTLEMYLPELDALTLAKASIKKTSVSLDGKPLSTGTLARARTLELPAGFGRQDWMTSVGDERAVSATTSLFADEPVRGLRVPVVIACGFGHATRNTYSPDKKAIRDKMRQARARLRHCFMKEAQRDPSIGGRVDVHFTIGRDGRVFEISTDGTLTNPEVHSCIAEDLSAWKFPESELGGNTRVNYPLEFVLNR